MSEHNGPQNGLCFRKWLEDQIATNTSIRELSRHAVADKCWPISSTDYMIIRHHIRVMHDDYPPEALVAFDQAWQEFQEKVLNLRALTFQTVSMSQKVPEIVSTLG